MQKIGNHFNNNTTYVVGEYFINGCQYQHINDLDRICKIFNVPNNDRQDVFSV